MASFGWSEPSFGEVAAWLHAKGVKQRQVDVRVEHAFWPVRWRSGSQRSRDLMSISALKNKACAARRSCALVLLNPHQALVD